MKYIRFYTTSLLTLLPSIMFAATASQPRDFKGFVSIVVDLIQTLIIFIFVLTFLAILWGVIRGWIIQGGDTEGVESGKKVVFAGVIGLVVMSAIWGILQLIQAGLFGG